MSEEAETERRQIVPCDNYKDCAERHLNDADFLFQNNRLDNAIYLAGFAIECALKFAVEYYQRYGLREPRTYNHNVDEIASLMDSQLIRNFTLLPDSLSEILNQIQSTSISGHPLYGHPFRRYWTSGYWSSNDVENAINLAKEVYQRIVASIQTIGRVL